MNLEGYQVNNVLYDLPPTLNYLLEHLETTKHTYTTSNSTCHLLNSIQLAWQKLDKYYIFSGSNTVLYIVVALYSSMKFEYVEVTCPEHPDRIMAAKSKVNLLWKTWYVYLVLFYISY